MGIIRLEEMEFFAYHGFFSEERKVGNRYGATVEVDFDFEKAALDDRLTETVDYGQIYDLVRIHMLTPAKLLEHIAREIALSVKTAYPGISGVRVWISKYNPPIGGVCGKAEVMYSLPN